MPSVARRLFLPLIAIARSEGLPIELVEPPASGLPHVAYRHLVDGALRLGEALGSEAALLAAASRGEVWPELVPLARTHPSTRALSRHLWESHLPAMLPGFETSWQQTGESSFEARARFDSAWVLRPGLGTVLAGSLAALPLFHGLVATRVSCAGSAGELVVLGELPASERAVHVDRRRLPNVSALATVGGAIEDRALEKVRRMNVTGATAALADGLARSQDPQQLGEAMTDVLATYLHFTQIRIWMSQTGDEGSTCVSLGTRTGTSRVLVVRHAARRVALIEVDEEGDLAALQALLPWLACAIAHALQRESPLPPEPRELPFVAELTPRQRQITDLLAAGLGNKEIANALGCAEATVEDHLTAVYRKACVRGRTALLARLRAARVTAIPA